MRAYECMVIVDPERKKDEIEKLFGKLETLITKEGGRVEEIKEWGLRKLAYPIKKHEEALYYLLYFEAPLENNIVPKVEGLLKMSEPVLRFLTTKRMPYVTTVVEQQEDEEQEQQEEEKIGEKMEVR